MALTPRGIWTPDSGEEYDLTVDAATTASTIDNALQKSANYGLGTTAQMNAALGDFQNGAMWWNTTNSTEYRKVSGAWVANDVVQAGTASITNPGSSGGSVAVTFPRPFPAAPVVVVSPVTTNASVRTTGAFSITATGFSAWAVRETAGNMSVSYVAVYQG